METLTPLQLQTKIQNINVVMNTVYQLKQWLQQYQYFQLNNYSMNVPFVETILTLDETIQTKFLDQYDKLYTQLQKQVTNL